MSLDTLRVTALVAFAFVVMGSVVIPTQAAPAPTKKSTAESGVVVLDNCDPEYKGKNTYDDGLTFLSGAGKLRARTSGLNVCEEIGSPNRIAIDVARKRVWVTETVGHRLLQYDFAGKEQLVIRDVKASALAVDPATGNVWVAAGTGRIGGGWVEVYDPKGKRLAKHECGSAYDLVYDPKSKAIWTVEKQLVKLSLEGKELVRKDVADWCAVSVAVNAKTGDVWTVVRDYSEKDKNALVGHDSDGKLRHTIKLGDKAIPFRVAVNPRDGSVWVVDIRKSLLHFDAKGKRLGEHELGALTVAVNSASDNVWIVTKEEILDVDPRGKIVGRNALRAKTSQAWIASY